MALLVLIFEFMKTVMISMVGGRIMQKTTHFVIQDLG